MPPNKKIAIISVLKPVDDARNYKKIAKTLGENQNYEIWVAGFPSNPLPDDINIHIIPTKRFKRISLYRVIVPFLVLKKLLKVKPDLVIVNTHELLGVTLLNQILFGAKVIYDVQENYFVNIRHSKAFPGIIRLLLAYHVRMREIIASRFIHGFIISDKCYEEELNFLHEPYQIVENKSVINISSNTSNDLKSDLTIVYSGTIAEEYGIFDAIDFVKRLKSRLPQISLVIIGYCANKKTYDKLLKNIESIPYIKIVGGDTLVSQNEIVKQLESADFCILPYRNNTYYSNRIPTKIYDCLCLKRPILIRNNPAWRQLYSNFDAFILTDFSSINDELLDSLQNKKFYTTGDFETVRWETEKAKLQRLVSEVLNI